MPTTVFATTGVSETPGSRLIELPLARLNPAASRAIERAAGELAGVEQVTANPASKRVRIVYDPETTSTDELVKAVEERYIFPDGELVPVSEANLIAESAGFEVRDVENLREHYALTLRQWVNRLEARRDEAIDATSEVTYRTWRLYLAASAYGFEAARINVNQTLLSRQADGNANIPLTRADLYV